MYTPILNRNTSIYPFWCSYIIFGRFYPLLCERNRHVIIDLIPQLISFSRSSPKLNLSRPFSLPPSLLLSLLSLSLSLSARSPLFPSPSPLPALSFPLPLYSTRHFLSSSSSCSSRKKGNGIIFRNPTFGEKVPVPFGSLRSSSLRLYPRLHQSILFPLPLRSGKISTNLLKNS